MDDKVIDLIPLRSLLVLLNRYLAKWIVRHGVKVNETVQKILCSKKLVI